MGSGSTWYPPVKMPDDPETAVRFIAETQPLCARKIGDQVWRVATRHQNLAASAERGIHWGNKSGSDSRHFSCRCQLWAKCRAAFPGQLSLQNVR